MASSSGILRASGGTAQLADPPLAKELEHARGLPTRRCHLPPSWVRPLHHSPLGIAHPSRRTSQRATYMWCGLPWGRQYSGQDDWTGGIRPASIAAGRSDFPRHHELLAIAVARSVMRPTISVGESAVARDQRGRLAKPGTLSPPEDSTLNQLTVFGFGNHLEVRRVPLTDPSGIPRPLT